MLFPRRVVIFFQDTSYFNTYAIAIARAEECIPNIRDWVISSKHVFTERNLWSPYWGTNSCSNENWAQVFSHAKTLYSKSVSSFPFIYDYILFFFFAVLLIYLANFLWTWSNPASDSKVAKIKEMQHHAQLFLGWTRLKANYIYVRDYSHKDKIFFNVLCLFCSI